jgi:hypothetical protein
LRKKKNNKWQFGVLFLIIISIMFYGLYSSITKKNDLINNSKNTIGVITKIEHRTSRGYFIEYNYVVNGRKYYRTQKLTIEKESIKLYDKFNVIYSPKNPKNCRLIFEKRITQ